MNPLKDNKPESKVKLTTFKKIPRLNYKRPAMTSIAVLLILTIGWTIGSVMASSSDRVGGVENQSPASLSTTETDIDGSADGQGVGVLPPIDAIPVYWAPQGRYFFTFIDGEMYRINLTGIERYHVTAYLDAPGTHWSYQSDVREVE